MISSSLSVFYYTQCGFVFEQCCMFLEKHYEKHCKNTSFSDLKWNHGFVHSCKSTT